MLGEKKKGGARPVAGAQKEGRRAEEQGGSQSQATKGFAYYCEELKLVLTVTEEDFKEQSDRDLAYSLIRPS